MDDNKVPSYLTIALCHDKSIEVENLSKKKKQLTYQTPQFS